METHDKNDDINSIPEWVMNDWRQQEKTVTKVFNEKVTAIFVDENGENKFPLNTATLGIQTPPCDSEEGDFVDNTFTYMSQATGFTCDDDTYSMHIIYQLSTAFTPTTVHPTNPSLLSRGRLRLKDLSGNVIYTNNSITPITITPMGTDPFNSNRQLYNIEYTLSGIPRTLMENRGADEHRPIIYTTCDQVITTPALWQQGLPGSIISACTKVDKVYVTPQGSDTLVYFGGCDNQISTIGSCYPTDLLGTRPDEHDIEWRKVTDTAYANWPMPIGPYSNITATSYKQRIAWTYFPGSSCSTYPLKKAILGSYDARAFKFPVTGTIEIRYRNIKLNTPINSCAAVNCTSNGWVYQTISVL